MTSYALPSLARAPRVRSFVYMNAACQQSNGKTAFDVDIDGMEEQPWRHSGVDIADFFNYGFTEESWRVYCEKQLRCVESCRPEPLRRPCLLTFV